jgi:hypothetical protein
VAAYRDGVGYQDTLIAVAEDCPVGQAVVPPARAGRPTVARLQYDLLAGGPYTYTQEDILFESWYRREEELSAGPAELAALRAEFFAQPRACLRGSPLPKRYGWGLHFDGDGRVALYAVESAAYQRYADGAERAPSVLRALRSSRARS